MSQSGHDGQPCTHHHFCLCMRTSPGFFQSTLVTVQVTFRNTLLTAPSFISTHSFDFRSSVGRIRFKASQSNPAHLLRFLLPTCRSLDDAHSLFRHACPSHSFLDLPYLFIYSPVVLFSLLSACRFPGAEEQISVCLPAFGWSNSYIPPLDQTSS